MALQPNQSFTRDVVSTSGANGTLGIDFGFDADLVVVANDKASPVYVNANSSSGSTAGFEVAPGRELRIDRVRARKIGLASTSTSTGDFVRVGAWGG